MQATKQIIDLLNSVLIVELTSINRYFLHARMCRNWGLENLNHVNYGKSIKDMKQADELMERILFLEGLPNLQQIDLLQVGETVEEMLKCDLAFQIKQRDTLKNAIKQCEDAQDYVSRQILVDILEYEEEHIDWVETQQFQIGKIGIQNYLQSQMSEDD